jgi:hypothetical protein
MMNLSLLANRLEDFAIKLRAEPPNLLPVARMLSELEGAVYDIRRMQCQLGREANLLEHGPINGEARHTIADRLRQLAGQ